MDNTQTDMGSKKQNATKDPHLSKCNGTKTYYNKEDQPYTNNIQESQDDLTQDETKKDTHEKDEIENSIDKKSQDVPTSANEKDGWTIISQGQCGADLGALEAAVEAKLSTGGFACKGYTQNEEGIINEKLKNKLKNEYNLKESEGQFGTTDRANARMADIVIGFRWRKEKTGMGTCKVVRFKETNLDEQEYKFIEAEDNKFPNRDIITEIKTRCIIIWDLEKNLKKNTLKKKVLKFIRKKKAKKIMISGPREATSISHIGVPSVQKLVKDFLFEVFQQLKNSAPTTNATFRQLKNSAPTTNATSTINNDNATRPSIENNNNTKPNPSIKKDKQVHQKI